MDEITHVWNFNPLEITYSINELSNIISDVHWQYTAIHTSSSVSATEYGVVRLEPPTVESFILFDNVTKEEVTGWVTASLGQNMIDSLNTNLSASISNQLFPVRGVVSPPWN